ncbi:MAG: hypothetical protein LBV61_07330 [Burkholderiaceae bacterium]|jgi:chemosensory pili system protein ChpA (sensor histidine kinase/response regulator)|nr:hypothetical protein [Burkholderiaceae bacterium]
MPTDASHDAKNSAPLAGMLAQICNRLESASTLLRRFARECAQASDQAPDIDADTQQPLLLACLRLYQAVSALKKAGQPAPARVLGALAWAVHGLAQESARCTETTAATLSRAILSVRDFLRALHAGAPVSPLALFPQYRMAIELASQVRAHPADLWVQHWRWAPVSLGAGQQLAYGPQLRAQFDQLVLRAVQYDEISAARQLCGLCVGLARGAGNEREHGFWALAGAFFEAYSLAPRGADGDVKRTAVRVLLQYAALARGDETRSEPLAQDLLFFCVQAAPVTPEAAPVLDAVRTAWGIFDTSPRGDGAEHSSNATGPAGTRARVQDKNNPGREQHAGVPLQTKQPLQVPQAAARLPGLGPMSLLDEFSLAADGWSAKALRPATPGAPVQAAQPPQKNTE